MNSTSSHTTAPRERRARALARIALATLILSLFAANPSRAAMDRPDAWITTKVKISLLTSDGVPATAVNVDTVDGRVTLHGIVATDTEKARAEQVARSIEGVRTVNNLLQVVPSSRKEAVKVADNDLQKNVEAVLSRDAALSDSSVKVASVHDGVVLLSGTAKTLSAHRRALADARAVPGVKRVSTEIQSPDRLADEEIASRGPIDKDASMKSAAYDAWIDINVDTNGGVVTLFGTVPSEASKKLAAAEVKKINGVKSVDNQLQIVPKKLAEAVEQSDDKIKSAIEKKIENRQELSDAKIDVEVSNGVARLTGSAESQSDRLVALATVRSVPGVRSVIDELNVTPRVSSR